MNNLKFPKPKQNDKRKTKLDYTKSNKKRKSVNRYIHITFEYNKTSNDWFKIKIMQKRDLKTDNIQQKNQIN